jgi:copper homeostasis protein (lipoprotein)
MTGDIIAADRHLWIPKEENPMKRALPVAAVLILVLGGCAGMPGGHGTPAAAASGQTAVMRGMYSHLADAALFTECESDKTLPVLMEGDNRALEQAYLGVQHESGEALLVTLEGRVVSRMPREGWGSVDMLLPERFIGIQPRKTCKTPVASPGLLGTDWKLTYLGDVPAEQFKDQRDVHILLQKDDRVTGSDGCNLLNGGFTLEGDRLAFSRIATTMMACPQGAEQEQRFHRALANTARYRIVTEFLELMDGAGVVLARFEALPPG